MNRSFYALLVSQTATNLGFALYTMVVVLYIYTETGSTTLSAAVTMLSMGSRMVSGILLPIIADRIHLPKLLLLSQSIQFLLLIGIMLLISQSLSTLFLVVLFVLLSFISFFNGFFSPVKSSLVKSVVPDENRIKANSLLASVDQTFLFAGWTFGGLLLAFLGKEVTLTISFLLILCSILSLYFVQVGRRTEINTQEGYISRLTAGWTYLFRHKGLRVLVTMDILETLVGSIWIGAVTLTYVQEALGKGEAWWGYINGAYYLGTIVGGFLVYRLSKVMQGKLTLFMLIGSVLFGLLTFTYGFIGNPYLALFFVLLMGPAYQIRDLAQETIYQNSADEQILTKLLAAKAVLVQFIFIISVLGIGVLTDLIGVRPVYILSGSLLIISSLYGFIRLHIHRHSLSFESKGNGING